MNITYGQLKKTIDKRASIMVNTNRAKDRITELLIELLDFEMISSETYQKAMNYVFQEKEWQKDGKLKFLAPMGKGEKDNI